MEMNNLNKTIDVKVNEEELGLIIKALQLLKNSCPHSFSIDKLLNDVNIYFSSQLKRLEILNKVINSRGK